MAQHLLERERKQSFFCRLVGSNLKLKHHMNSDIFFKGWIPPHGRRLPGARVTRNEVAELSQDVSSHLDQVLVAGGSLQRLRVCTRKDDVKNVDGYLTTSMVSERNNWGPASPHRLATRIQSLPGLPMSSHLEHFRIGPKGSLLI